MATTGIPLADLRSCQCRFPVTPHHAREHRFCGAPTTIRDDGTNKHGSWCDAHYPIVCEPYRRGGGVLKNRERSA